ncbi:MAG TPA: class I SAM-dependent methyltransferase [Candidatus Acidoferrales bacterium]|nr:class I SAM-dependent methyltransferase [Candidatus Acidoferrales bacterium]
MPAQDSGEKRDEWQRPQEVMDALGITAGSAVADVGSGNGYFTFHLAERVGAAGRVYAVDIDEGALKKLREKAEKEKLAQIETIVGAAHNPRLAPESVEVVLVVNAYHEMRDYDLMLAALYRALKPGGRLAIIDGGIEPGQKRESYFSRHRVPKEAVREEAEGHGFVFAREEKGFTRGHDGRKFYFLVFQKTE